MAWNNFWPEIDNLAEKRKYIIIIKKKIVELTLYRQTIYSSCTIHMLYAVYKVL